MQTSFLLSGCLAMLSCTAIFGTPCVPGNLQTFSNLGATGCKVETVQFTNFTILPGQTVATPIDPAQVQVTPGGTALNPTLLFTLNKTANTGEAFELFFRFSASDSLIGTSVGLTPPKRRVMAQLPRFSMRAPMACSAEMLYLAARLRPHI